MNVQSFIHLNHASGQEVYRYRAKWWPKALGDKCPGKELPFNYPGARGVSTLSCLMEKYLNYIIIKPRMLFYLKAKDFQANRCLVNIKGYDRAGDQNTLFYLSFC